MNKIENSFNTCAVELIFIFSDKYGKYIYKFSKNLLTIATMLFCFFCILLLTSPALTRK
mgnify:CR=1 FL=1